MVDVLVQETLVAVLLFRPLAQLGVDQGNKISLISFLPLGHTGHPLHWRDEDINI